MSLALRLRGLIVFWRGDARRAFEWLEQSLEIARAQRHAGQTLATIGALEQIAWHVPGYDVVRLLECERLQLAERSGFQPSQWTKALGEPFELQLETHGREGLVDYTQRARRFAIDVGDVLGEMQATDQFAAAWWELGEYAYARMELVRSELLFDYLGTTSGAGVSAGRRTNHSGTPLPSRPSSHQAPVACRMRHLAGHPSI